MDANYKNRFLKNLRTILKRKNIKMSDFEQKIGVSKGYFSRLDSNNSTASPKVNTLMKAVEYLGYSVDTLLTEDLSAMDSDKIKLVEKLKKIKELIEVDKIQCHYISSDSYTNTDDFACLRYTTFNSETYEFTSFYTEYADLVEDGFFYFYYKDNEYHIYKVTYDNPGESEEFAYEFYVIIDGSTKKICNGTYTNDLYLLMYHLYEAARANSKRFRVDAETLKILDDF